MAHPARTHLVHPPRTHLAARTPKSPPRPVLYPAPPSVIHFSAASRGRAREGPPGGLSCDGPQPRPGGFSVYDVPRPGGCCCGFELEGARRCMKCSSGVPTHLALRPVGRRRFRPTSPRCLKGPPGEGFPSGESSVGTPREVSVECRHCSQLTKAVTPIKTAALTQQFAPLGSPPTNPD